MPKDRKFYRMKRPEAPPRSQLDAITVNGVPFWRSKVDATAPAGPLRVTFYSHDLTLWQPKTINWPGPAVDEDEAKAREDLLAAHARAFVNRLAAGQVREPEEERVEAKEGDPGAFVWPPEGDEEALDEGDEESAE